MGRFVQRWLLVPAIVAVGLSVPPIAAPSATAVVATGADLVPVVVASGPAATGGEAIFTVTVSNRGGQSSSGPVSVALTPSGSLRSNEVRASGGGWSCLGGANLCTRTDSLSVGAAYPALTVELSVHADYLSASHVQLRATVTGTADAVPGNNDVMAQSPVSPATAADLALSIAPTGPAVSGGVAEFSVGVRNLTTVAAAGPVEVTFSPSGSYAGSITGAGTGWVCPQDANKCAWTAGTPPSTMPALTVRIPVAQLSIAEASSVTMYASVSSANDGITANNSTSAVVPVVWSSAADYAVSVSGTGLATAGKTAAFRVRVRNVGGSDHAGPVEVGLMSGGGTGSAPIVAAGAGWTCPASSNTCVRTGPVGAGATLPDLTVTTSVRPDYPQAATVSLSATVSSSADQVRGNDTATASSPVVADGHADATVAVTPQEAATVGGLAGFTVVVRNLGTETSTGPFEVALNASGSLDDTTVTGSGTGWSCPAEANRCVASGSLGPGRSLPDLHVSASITSDPTRAFSVGVAASVVSGNDSVSLNNSASTTVPVLDPGTNGPDVSPVISGVAPLSAGATATVPVTVRNSGDVAFPGPVNVSLSSTFDTTYVGAGWTCTAAGSCTHAGPLAPGASLPPLTGTAAVPRQDPPAQGSWWASLDVSDANQSNQSAAITTAVGLAPVDLAVEVRDTVPVTAGASGSAAIRVTNTGPVATDGVSIAISTSAAGASAVGAGWTCTTTLACAHAGPLAAHSALPDLLLTLPSRPTDPPSTESIGVSVGDPDDANTRNSSATAAYTTGRAAVDLVTWVNGVGAVSDADAQSSTVWVRNAGTAPSSDVTLNVGVATSGASAVGQGWQCTRQLVCSHAGPVAGGASLPPLTVTQTVPSDDAAGSLTVQSVLLTSSDATTRNDVGSAGWTFGPKGPDVTIAVRQADVLRAGTTGDVVLRVANLGTQALSGETEVQVSSPYPNASVAGEGWSCTSGLTCTRSGVLPGGAVLPDVTLTTEVPAGTSAGAATFGASITQSEETRPRNNATSLVLPVTATAGPARLTPTLVSNQPATLEPGDPAQFSLTLTNNAAVDVPGPLTVSAKPSIGLTVEQLAGAGWSCGPSQCTYPLGLNPGDSVTVTATGHVSPSASGTVYLVMSGRGPGTVAAAATSAVTVAGTGVDLTALVNATGPAPAGGSGSFVVRLRNSGAVATTGPVEVRLTPGGSLGSLSVVASGPGWSCPAITNTCITTGVVPAGGVTSALQARVAVAPSVHAHDVSLSASVTAPHESVPGNDWASASAPVVRSAGPDLAIAASTGSPALAGGTGASTVVVRNVGSEAVTDRVDVALSPANGETITASGTGWVCPPTARSCVTDGDVAPGEQLPPLTVVAESPVDHTVRGSFGLSATVNTAGDRIDLNDSAWTSGPVVAGTGADPAVEVEALGVARTTTGARFVVRTRNLGTAATADPVELMLQPSGSYYGSLISAAGAGWVCPQDSNRCVTTTAVAPGASLPDLTVSFPIYDVVPTGSTASLSASLSSPRNALTANDNAAAQAAVAGDTSGAAVAGTDVVATVSGAAPVMAGQPSTAQIQVSNAGVAAVPGTVTVAVASSAGSSTAAGSGWNCTSTLMCSHDGPLGPGATLPALTVTMPTPTLDAAGQLSVWAAVVDPEDTVTGNNTASLATTVGLGAVDLSVHVTGTRPVVAGQQVTASARVRNSGAQTSSPPTVQLAATFPGATASGTGWTCTSALACTYQGGVPAGTTVPDLSIAARVPSQNAAGTANLSAFVTADDDGNTRNSAASSSAGVGEGATDLTVVLTDAQDRTAGQPSTFTARVGNAGSAASSGPVSLQIATTWGAATATGPGWSCTTGLTCTHAGPVPPGATLPDLEVSSVTPEAVTPGVASSSAWVTNSSDSNLANNDAVVTVPVLVPRAHGVEGSSFFDVESLVPRVAVGSEVPLQAQIAETAVSEGGPATLAVTLPEGVEYVAGSSDGLEPSQDGRLLSFAVTGTPAPAITFRVRVGQGLTPQEVTIRSTLSSALLGAQNDSASFQVDHPSLQSLTTASVGTGASVTVGFLGDLLDPGFGFSLVGPQTVTAASSSGNSRQVDAVFDLRTAALGDYTATVTLPGGTQLAGPTVHVSALDLGALGVDLSGPSRVRLNAPGQYYVTVTNNGNADMYDVPVVLTVPQGLDATTVLTPEVRSLAAQAIDLMTSATPGLGELTPEMAASAKAYIQDYVPTAAPDPDPAKPVQYLMTLVPKLPVGGSATSAFSVTPRTRVDAPVVASAPVDTSYWAATGRVSDVDRRFTAPATGKIETLSDGVAAVCNDPALAAACPTVRGYINGYKETVEVAGSYACVSFSAPVIPGALQNPNCSFKNPFNPLDIAKELLKYKYPNLKPVDKWLGVFGFAKGIYDKLMGAADRIEKGYDGVAFGVTSVDPNEIRGPVGFGPARWVRGGSDVAYTIEFENIASAEAPAQLVTITQQLPDQLDWSTARVVGAQVGTTQVPVAQSVSASGSHTAGAATLEPGRAVLVDADVDAATGQLTTRLHGPSRLDDPFNPSPYADFLPPNVTKPQGQGQILVTARLKPGVATGSIIRGKATIVFDQHLDGPTIATNEWTNAVDGVAPVSGLAALPTYVKGSVQLIPTSTDQGSGIQRHEVFQSVDGGAVTQVVAPTGPGPVSVPVVGGHRYAFAVRPVDGAGNLGALSAFRPTQAVTDATAPKVVLTGPTVATQLGTTVKLTWTATDALPSPRSWVRYRLAGTNGRFGSYVAPSGLQNSAALSATLPVKPGITMCMSVQSADAVGNRSAWTPEKCVVGPVDDRALAASTGWTRGANTSAYLRTLSSTTRTGATLTSTTVVFRRLDLVATTCSTCGRVGIYLNGTLIKTVSLATTTTRSKVVIPVVGLGAAARSGRIVVRSLDSKRHYIDGLGIAAL